MLLSKFARTFAAFAVQTLSAPATTTAYLPVPHASPTSSMTPDPGALTSPPGPIVFESCALVWSSLTNVLTLGPPTKTSVYPLLSAAVTSASVFANEAGKVTVFPPLTEPVTLTVVPPIVVVSPGETVIDFPVPAPEVPNTTVAYACSFGTFKDTKFVPELSMIFPHFVMRSLYCPVTLESEHAA